MIETGRRAGVLAAVGINVGAYVHVLAAVLGISAILATSPEARPVNKACSNGCRDFPASTTRA